MTPTDEIEAALIAESWSPNRRHAPQVAAIRWERADDT